MKTPSIRYGLLGALAIVFLFGLAYVIRPGLFLNTWLYWGTLLIYLLFMYRASVEDCAQNGSGRDFREIVRTPFVVFLLINLGYWLLYYALHLTDQELIVLEVNAKIQYLQQQIQAGTGDPVTANDLRQQIADLEKLKADPVQPLGPVLAQMARGALGGFVLAAGIAAIVRSKS